MMLCLAAGLISIIAASGASHTKPEPADTLVRSAHVDTARVVRHFPTVEVAASRIHDLRSSEQVHVIAPAALRTLPIESFARAVALQAGVVALGEDLHVRGGRAGETALEHVGLPLVDPLSGRSPVLPLFTVRDADVLAGGLDADHAGALAGVIDVRTEDPTPQPHASLRYTSDGRRSRGLDWAGMRATGPLARGIGFAAAAEAQLDDQGLPALRTRGREASALGHFGWRNDNQLRAWAKLAPVESPQRLALEVFASRSVQEPYDPMFAYDDSVYTLLPRLPILPTPRRARADSIVYDSSAYFYRAADHKVMTDTRSLGATLSAARLSAQGSMRVSLGYTAERSLTSVGLRDDPYSVRDAGPIVFGKADHVGQNPFLAIGGDEPYYRKSRSQRWLGQVAWMHMLPRQNRLMLGAGASEDEVQLLEIDRAAPRFPGADSVRQYHAWAPGAWMYAQHRWENLGLIWNDGVRIQMFTPGPQAVGGSTTWSISPRLGFAYPVTDRDAFSVAYVRVHQDPARDQLYDSRRVPINRRPLGSGRLVPAELLSWQAAIKHLFNERWTAQAGVFYRDYFSQTGVRTAPLYAGTYRAVYASEDEGTASGYEAAVHGRFHQRDEVTLRYTYMNAWGTMSSENGYSYGLALGQRPLPISEHPLDWDRRHMLTVDALLHGRHGVTLAWVTQAASGLPWTPATRDDGVLEGPALATDLAALNSRRLPWSEATDVTIRCPLPRARGAAHASALFEARDLFDTRPDWRVNMSGFPNPLINSMLDEYGGFRTATGQDGGGYYSDPTGSGQPRWIAVHDARLKPPPRSLRLGVEVEF
jgi:hypothetical protein